MRVLISHWENRCNNIGNAIKCHLRCFLHVLSLAVWVFLVQKRCWAPVEGEEVIDDEETDHDPRVREEPIPTVQKVLGISSSIHY